MDWDVENRDVSSGHFFMKNHTVSEAKNHNSKYSTNKRDGNFPNVSEMEDTGLQDGVDIDGILSAWTLYQYSNMEHNNEYQFPLINNKTSSSNNYSVSILPQPYVTSRNDEVRSWQNTIHKNIKYSDWSKSQSIYISRVIDVMKTHIQLLAHKTWHYVILKYIMKYKAIQ